MALLAAGGVEFSLGALDRTATRPRRVDAGTVDAGLADAEDAGLPCDTTGISKGPWVLHVDGTSAIVRWEACRPATTAGVSYAPETGGAKLHATASESPFVVTSTIKVFNADAPPDYAGTWYMHDAAITGLHAVDLLHLRPRRRLDHRGALLHGAEPPGDIVRFAAIGDTNPSVAFNTREVVAKIVPLGFDFTLHGGDIEYYDSLVETYAYWFELMPPLLRGRRVPAGHRQPRQRRPDGLEPDDKYQQYTERFWGNAGFDGTTEAYAFSTGGVWFLTVDTEEPIETGEHAVPVGVESELAEKAAASPGYRFSIYYQHRPFLTCGDYGRQEHRRALSADAARSSRSTASPSSSRRSCTATSGSRARRPGRMQW